MYRIILFACFVFVFSSYGCEITVRFERYGVQAQKNPELGWHGLDVDFAKALLEKAGCKYRFVSTPWGRAIKMLELGDLDLVLSVSDNPKRRAFAYFVGPQRMENIVFAVHRDAPVELNSMEQLFALDRPVAIQRGAFYGQNFETHLAALKDPEQQFIYVADNNVKINLLKNQRISGFLEEKYNLLYQIENNPNFSEVRINTFIVNQEPVYYAFSKKSITPEQLTQFEAAYIALQKSGELKAILKKYKLD
ncbi:substrate-binding periplasmic protein [Pseudoalteromonas xiamenensis]